MQILLWLMPPVLVTLVSMAWVGWVGREGRGVVGRDEAARRIGVALERESGSPRHQRRAPGAGARAPREQSAGVVVRRTAPAPAPARVTPVEPLRAPTSVDGPPADAPARRAS